MGMATTSVRGLSGRVVLRPVGAAPVVGRRFVCGGGEVRETTAADLVRERLAPLAAAEVAAVRARFAHLDRVGA